MAFPENGRFRSMLAKWFTSRADLGMFTILAVAGIISALATFHLLDGYSYNSGKKLIGVFVPPFLCVLYLTVAGLRHKLDRTYLVKALVLYLIQIAPFAPLFFQVFQPTPGDDFSRYCQYARNMISHRTLWGGDRLFFPAAGNHYVTQPGYRYFILLELLVFRDLYRVVPFFNTSLYLVSVFCFQQAIQQVPAKKLRAGLLLLILACTPYTIKNLLMGLPEWLTVVMLMAAACLSVRLPRSSIAFFLLGLVPFFRQNLLVTAVLLAAMLLLYHSRKVKSLIFFVVPLFLPVYHNLYYAGKWRFFVDIFQMPFLTYSPDSRSTTGWNGQLIINNIIHYAGIDMENGQPAFSLIALLFLPFSVLIYVLMVKSIAEIRIKAVFILITMSAVVPAVFLGSAYYPRFEFVNAAVMLCTFLLLPAGRSPRESYLHLPDAAAIARSKKKPGSR